jgi:hypothetical protein
MAIFKGPVLGSNVVRLFSNFTRFLLGPISIVLDPAVFEIRQKFLTAPPYWICRFFKLASNEIWRGHKISSLRSYFYGLKMVSSCSSDKSIVKFTL